MIMENALFRTRLEECISQRMLTVTSEGLVLGVTALAEFRGWT